VVVVAFEVVVVVVVVVEVLCDAMWWIFNIEIQKIRAVDDLSIHIRRLYSASIVLLSFIFIYLFYILFYLF